MQGFNITEATKSDYWINESGSFNQPFPNITSLLKWGTRSNEN